MKVRDFADAIEALEELNGNRDSRELVNEFLDRVLDDVIYYAQLAQIRIYELEEELEKGDDE